MLTVLPQPNPQKTALDRYLATAQRVGCPTDQLRHFRAVGYIPEPKQLHFHAAARSCDATTGPVEVGYGGARGPGKSHAVLAQIGADDCQRLPGAKWLLLRKVGKAAKEGFEDLLARAFPPWLRYYVPSRSQLVYPNGSRIIIGHFQHERDIDAYLGLEYDGIGIEEATTLSYKKYQAVTTVCRTSKPNWRPRIYSTTNPGGVGHAYYKARFVEPQRKRQETDTRFIHATIDDNPHINPEYRNTLDKLTGWELRAYRYGDWDIAAGQFFTTWDYTQHVCNAFPIPSGWRVWCALDYGFVHPTACYLLAQDGDGKVYIVDEHVQSRWLPEKHAGAIIAMLARNGVPLARLVTFVAGADVFARRGEITIAEEYRAHGIHLRAANDDRINGAAEWLRRLGDVARGVPARIAIFGRCTRLIGCLPMLEHNPHRPEDVLKVDIDEQGNGGDDPYDGSRYGLMEAPSLDSRVVRSKPVANRWSELKG